MVFVVVIRNGNSARERDLSFKSYALSKGGPTNAYQHSPVEALKNVNEIGNRKLKK